MEEACAGIVFQVCNRCWDAMCGGARDCGASLIYFCFCSQLLQSTKISQGRKIPMWSQDLIFPGLPTSPGLKMNEEPIALPSNKSPPSPVSLVPQGSARTSGLLCQQCLLTSQSSKVTRFSKWPNEAAEVCLVHPGKKNWSFENNLTSACSWRRSSAWHWLNAFNCRSSVSWHGLCTVSFPLIR